MEDAASGVASGNSSCLLLTPSLCVRRRRAAASSSTTSARTGPLARANSRFLLDRHYRRLLGKPLLDNPSPDRSAQAKLWVERVHREPGQFFELLGEWIMSEAYREALAVPRVRNDRQFIRALYMDLLERTPSYQELRNMRNAMQSMADPAPLRSVMAKVILDSGQARLPGLERGREAEFVTECFRTYLARDPGQGETAAFVEILRDGAEARHVVRALVGSPEYQYY